MTNDSRLFPTLEQWEAKGYKPDVFGRWVGPDGEIALPVYEGRMIGLFDISQNGWINGKGRTAVWRGIPFDAKSIEPQYLMSATSFRKTCDAHQGVKLAFMDITSGTNTRTMICVAHQDLPFGNSAPVLTFRDGNVWKTLFLAATSSSLCFDFAARQRVGGVHLNWYVVEEFAIPSVCMVASNVSPAAYLLALNSARLTFLHRRFAPEWLKLKHFYPELGSKEWKHWWAVTEADRLRLRVEIDALCADLYGLDPDDFDWIVRDDPTDPKGFYRVDRQLPFRERLTGLAATAFRALKEGKWSAETAASLSNDEFFDLLGIPELTDAQAAHAKGLPGPLIEKRVGCHVWHPENFPRDDPRHGWTWDDCWQDAVALLGSEEAVHDYLADRFATPEDKQTALAQAQGSPSPLKQRSLF